MSYYDPTTHKAVPLKFLENLRWRINDVRDFLMRRNHADESVYGIDEWSTPSINLRQAVGKLDDAIAAAPEVPDGWLDIADAPKDQGIHLLMHGDGDAIEDCTYTGYWDLIANNGWVLLDGKTKLRPRYYLPLSYLPPPPTEKAG